MKGTIRQRNPGSWEIQVFLGRDANGKRIRKTETVRGKKSDANVGSGKYCQKSTGEPSRPTHDIGSESGWINGWTRSKLVEDARRPSIVMRG